MLWAKQFKDEHQALLRRVKSMESSYAELTTSSKHLQKQQDDLQSKYKDLQSKYDEVQKDNDSLTQKVSKLEKVIVDSSVANDAKFRQLQDSDDLLRKGLESNVESVEQWRCSAEASHQSLKEGIRNLRLQQDDLATSLQIYHRDRTGMCRRQRGNDIFLSDTPAVSKSFSQATTVDEVMDMDESSGLSIEDCLQEDLNLVSQGKMTLEEYLKYGDDAIERAIKAYETRATKAFVDGMRDIYQKKPLGDRLDEQGWTWQTTRDELHRMIEDVKRRRRNKRYILPFGA